jgi:type II secretory pathway pseudopilin PulG
MRPEKRLIIVAALLGAAAAAVVSTSRRRKHHAARAQRHAYQTHLKNWENEGGNLAPAAVAMSGPQP